LADVNELEERIKKLEEKKSFRELFVQNLFGPLLVALVGGLGALYIQYVANRTQTQLDTTTKQIERMKVAQEMIADLFSDNHERALATEQILTRLLDDDDLEKTIHEQVTHYYGAKVVGAIAAGNFEQASNIVDSVKQIDSPTAKQIVQKAEKEHGAELAKGEKYKAAADLETQGFAALQAGNLADAKKSFAEAVKVAPEYHDVSRISRMVDRANEETDATRRQALAQEIFEKYSWKVTPEVREELRQQNIMQSPVQQGPPPRPLERRLPTLEER
jgi:hypothetical protein